MAALVAASMIPHESRPPNVHFELVVHSGAKHGRELFDSIETRIKRKSVSVLAIENAGHTREENTLLEGKFDQLRAKFNEWRRRENRPLSLLRAQASFFSQGVTKDPFFQAIMEISLIHDIPIRIAEEYSSQEGRRIQEMNKRHLSLLEQGAKETDLERSLGYVVQGYQLYRDITPLRDHAIERAVRRLDREYGKKGEVAAIFGEAHEGVPQSMNITSSRPNKWTQSFQNRQADVRQPIEQFSARVVLRTKLKEYLAERYRTEYDLENAIAKWEPLLEKVTMPDFQRIAEQCRGKKSDEKRFIIERELQKLQ